MQITKITFTFEASKTVIYVSCKIDNAKDENEYSLV